MGASIKQQVPHGGETDVDKTANAASKTEVDVLSSREASISVHSNPKTSWKSYIWDTFDKSPEERKFLFKLDAILMTLASLGYFIKYLDQVSSNMNPHTSGEFTDFLPSGEYQQCLCVWHERGPWVVWK